LGEDGDETQVFEVKDINAPTSNAFISDLEEQVDKVPCEL
jgi:hypothetical protein